MLPVCRALGAASPLPPRCSGRLFALFQKSKPRKLATGCERQDSRSMRSSMKVRAASSSAGFGDSPAVFVVWGPEAGRAAAHGEGQHLHHPAAPRGLGSDPDRGEELGGGGLWDGGSPLHLCCCGWRGEQPGSPAPRPAAGQQPAQLQTARSGLLVAGPGLGMSSGSPARPACHSSPSSGDEQKVPILQVGLVVYRLSARGGCRERSRSAGRGQDGGDCLLITWLFVKTLSPQSRLWCGEPAMLLTSLHS